MPPSRVVVDDKDFLHCKDSATAEEGSSRAHSMPCGELRNPLVFNKFHGRIHLDFSASSQVVHIRSTQFLYALRPPCSHEGFRNVQPSWPKACLSGVLQRA